MKCSTSRQFKLFSKEIKPVYNLYPCIRFSINPHLLQNLMMLCFLIFTNLVDVKRYLSEVLIYSSLVTNKFKHLSLLAICVSQSMTCLTIFLLGGLFFIICKNSLYILYIHFWMYVVPVCSLTCGFLLSFDKYLILV